MTHEEFMHCAFEEAMNGIRRNLGGPFGAVVVCDGIIIGRGCNMVTSTNDPSAHAEIVAIREACKNQESFHLSNAVLYATCEPCPMCMSAIYWANIKDVYYCSDRVDAEKIGFSDNFIYEELAKPLSKRSIQIKQLNLPDAGKLFDVWSDKPDKTPY
jgi:tRNA(Arg) A34 adenosine deaminase TadA